MQSKHTSRALRLWSAALLVVALALFLHGGAVAEDVVPGRLDAVLADLCGADSWRAGKDTPHIMPGTMPGIMPDLC